MANKLKLPKLNDDSKILSFDIETNGLHGQAFAVSGVIVDAKGDIVEQFNGRIPIEGPIDEWVKANVLPAIQDMTINYKNYEELKEAFWQWFKTAHPESDYVVVNNGYPIEYRFLLDCQNANITERYWEHPFPILDLTSLLIQVGVESNIDKQNFVKEFLASHTRQTHHPLQDATITALAAFKALRQSKKS